MSIKIEALMTPENIEYTATNIEVFKQSDGRKTVVFNLAKNRELLLIGDSNKPRTWNFWLDREEQSHFELGLCAVDEPAIVDSETQKELTLHLIDPDWLQNWEARGELTRV